jgi:xanthine dehydrogenase molybdenum-binding subunit
MGLGIGTLEDSEFDRKSGILLNCDIHQYRIPTVLETPEIDILNIEGIDSHYPYSGKPVGEAPLLGVAPAVRNAILHAIGRGLNALPMTPDRVLESLDD